MSSDQLDTLPLHRCCDLTYTSGGHREKLIVTQLQQAARVREGDVRCVVSAKWWRAWKLYVGFDTATNGVGDGQNGLEAWSAAGVLDVGCCFVRCLPCRHSHGCVFTFVLAVSCTALCWRVQRQCARPRSRATWYVRGVVVCQATAKSPPPPLLPVMCQALFQARSSKTPPYLVR